MPTAHAKAAQTSVPGVPSLREPEVEPGGATLVVTGGDGVHGRPVDLMRGAPWVPLSDRYG